MDPLTIRALTLLSFSLIGSFAASWASAGPSESRARVWLGRAWEIRYVLFVGTSKGLDATLADAREANMSKREGRDEPVYFRGVALFDKAVDVQVPNFGRVATLIVAFDRAGRVTSPHRSHEVLVGKRNLLGDIVLAQEVAPELKPFKLARWSQGIPGDVDFSPAVCNIVDVLRYGDGWNQDDYAGNFGCREWTAQLYSREQPYIDVTSYQSSGNYIGEFVGWSRFEDPPKPVIGKHGDTWVCLHECPGNEQPGVIPDIKKWAAKHNFPLPTRPDRQPLYPNSLYKDDLNEFDD